jgi:glycosyltransferase involved in cell wall biosynthesis
VISLVVPTRNRAHTLSLVASSWFQQDRVDEIVIVSDAGDDDSFDVVKRIAVAHPHTRVKLLRNDERLGASESRNVGVRACSNEFVLFCDDDEYLEPRYALTCLDKLIAFDAAAVSGRRVYMQPGESPAQAIRRFGHGMRNTLPFRPLLCEVVNGARFDGDRRQPITNAIILTRRALLMRHPFDGRYARGNGYREESDYQMNLFVNGHDIWVTNDCHSVHLPLALVKSGGQRTSVWRRIYWENHYNRYFLRKYYAGYARRVGLTAPRVVAEGAFLVFSLYKELLRPTLYRWVMAMHRRAASAQARPA